MKLPMTATTPSTPAEQSITGFIHAEIIADADTGQPTFCVAADQTLGDLREATSADPVYAATSAERARLNRIDRLATQFFQGHTTTEPRTWTVADSDTGMPLNVTCMSGCSGFHLEAAAGTAPAHDISCTQYDQANTTELAIGCGSDDGQDWATLSVEIQSDPVHPDPAKRIPRAAVEVTEDHYIESLDPDGLAAVIDAIEQRVAAMRVRHTELVRIRAEYCERQA